MSLRQDQRDDRRARHLLSKDDIMREVRYVAEVPLEKAREVITVIFEAMKRTLARGGEVNYRGFGTWFTYRRPDRIRHAGPGRKRVTDGDWRVRFRPSGDLKRRLAASPGTEGRKCTDCHRKTILGTCQICSKAKKKRAKQ